MKYKYKPEALAAHPWLEGFDPACIPNSLYDAFIWALTPQGVNFWSRRRRHGLDLEGAKALLEMVKIWKEARL